MGFIRLKLGSGKTEFKGAIFTFFVIYNTKNQSKKSKFTANSSSDEKYMSCVIPSVSI